MCHFFESAIHKERSPEGIQVMGKTQTAMALLHGLLYRDDVLRVDQNISKLY